MSERPTLWTRVKEARTVQAAVLYLGAAWFVLQLVATLQDMLSLPAWVGPVTVVLLAVGLLVVVATAWVQARPSTTEAEERGEVPTDWEVAPAEAFRSLRRGRLPHLTWGRAIAGGVVALSLVLGSAGLFVLLRGEVIALVSADGGSSGVAVLPFTVSGPGLDAFGEGMVSLVSTNIDGIDGIRAVSPRTVMAAWNDRSGAGETVDLAGALRVAGALGARYAVVGSGISTGSSVRISAELYDLDTGATVGSGQAEGALDGVLGVIDDMSVELLRSLVEEAGGQSVTGIRRLEGLTTSSVEALRAYLEAEAHMRSGRFDEALGAYERAVTADSTFALAWSRLARAQGWVAPGTTGEARRRAMTYLDRLPEREQTLVRADAGLSESVDLQLLADIRGYVRAFPDDPEGWAALGEYLVHKDRVVFDDEELESALLTAVDLDPAFAPYYIHALKWLIAKGDWRFYEYMELYRQVVSDEDVELMQRGWDFYWGSPEAQAEARDYFVEHVAPAGEIIAETDLASDSIVERSLDLIRAVEPDPAAEVLAPERRIKVLLSLGRFDDISDLRSLPPALRFTRAGFWSALGWVVATVVLDEPVGEMTVDDALGSWALVVEAAERFAADEDVPEGPDGPPGTPGEVLDLIRDMDASLRAMAGGDPGEAQRILERMDNPDLFTDGLAWSWWRVLYGEALARSGDLPGAARYFETALPQWRAVARLRLGEVHEELGDDDAARENFRGFLRLFEGAHESAEPLVARGRAGLARVEG